MSDTTTPGNQQPSEQLQIDLMKRYSFKLGDFSVPATTGGPVQVVPVIHQPMRIIPLEERKERK